MKTLLVGLCLTLMLAGSAGAGDNQADRIEQLERENYRLSMEVSRLRAELQRRRQTAHRYGAPYRSGQSSLQGVNRSLRELGQTRRSWDQLTK